MRAFDICGGCRGWTGTRWVYLSVFTADTHKLTGHEWKKTELPALITGPEKSITSTKDGDGC